MSTPRFLAKSEFVTIRPLLHNGVSVLDGHTTISALLSRLSSALGNFFAEPVLGGRSADGPRLASWYASYDGEAVPLTRLTDGAREAAEAQLRETLHQLRPLLADPVAGGLLAKALIIPSLDNVMVASGQIILVNWGTAQGGVGDDPAALSRHWDSTLGPFASFPPPWETGDTAPPAATESAASPPPIATARRAAEAVTSASAGLRIESAAVAGRLPWYQRGGTWFAGSALLFLLGLLIGFILIGFGSPVATAEDVSPEQLALQTSVNTALIEQINRLRTGLQGDICRIPQPLGSEGLNVPVKPLDNGKSAVIVPPSQTKPDQPPSAKTEHPSLATLLDRAAALVIVRKEDGIGFGTGFFIAPNVLATNAHVVEGAAPGSVTISNKSIGTLRLVDVVAQTTKGPDGEDYAILRTRDDVTAETTVLPLTTTIAKLDPVVAAGYPGVIIEADQAFRALLENRAGGAIPDLVATRGEVAAIQTLASNGLPAIAHTAIMSQGNSGGPLIDQCGRVVGINTFIVFNEKESPRQGNYAIASVDLLKFLKEKQIPVTVSEDRCSG